jgi:hypothetical protein
MFPTTAEEVDREMLAICQAYPNTSNPMDDEGDCLYQNPEDPNHHCLIGEFLTKVGIELPEEGEVINPVLWRLIREGHPKIPARAISVEVVDRFTDWQTAADSREGSRPAQWERVPHIVEGRS